jgi:hypothetical protein
VNDRLLTAAEVAEQLGFSPGWVLDRYEAGELDGIRFGKKGARVRFDPNDVRAFLDNRRSGPTMDLGQLSEVQEG